MENKYVIEIENLSHSYSKKIIYKDLNLKIKKAQFLEY